MLVSVHIAALNLDALIHVQGQAAAHGNSSAGGRDSQHKRILSQLNRNVKDSNREKAVSTLLTSRAIREAAVPTKTRHP